MRTLHRHNRGFSLTELAIVLGVMGTISGAIWWAASNAREAQKINDAYTELQTVLQNIDTLMAGQSLSGGCCNNITNTMITNQVIPSIYVNPANMVTANHPWLQNGFVVYNIAAKTFRLSFYSIPLDACTEIMLRATSCQANQVGCPTGVVTNGGQAGGAEIYPNSTTGWVGAVTTQTANTMCSQNVLPGGSLEFDYSL